MKLSELLHNQQKIILSCLDMEEWSWSNSNIWWSKGESEAAREMITQYGFWRKFSDAVRNDEEIEQAFCEWRNSVFGDEIPYDLIRTINTNVPMYAFKDCYSRAKRKTEEAKQTLDTQ